MPKIQRHEVATRVSTQRPNANSAAGAADKLRKVTFIDFCSPYKPSDQAAFSLDDAQQLVDSGLAV